MSVHYPALPNLSDYWLPHDRATERGRTQVRPVTLYEPGQRSLGHRSIGAPRNVVDQLRKSAEQTELFARADDFIDLKCTIDRKFEVAEVGALIAWCDSVALAIREHAVEPAPSRQ